MTAEAALAAYLFVENIGMGEMGNSFYDLDRRELMRMSNDSFGAVLVILTLVIGLYLIRGMKKANR